MLIGFGPFVFEKLSAVSHQLAEPPTAFCLPPAAFWFPTVASFLIPSMADPLLSCKSVASFFKKHSAFSHQPIR